MTAPILTYPTGPLTSHGSYYMLTGKLPEVQLRAYDNSIYFNSMGGRAIADPYTAPEGVCLRRHGMKGPVEIGGAVDQDERGLGHGKGLLMGGAWSWEPGHGKRRIVAELHII